MLQVGLSVGLFTHVLQNIRRREHLYFNNDQTFSAM